jgi:Tfp pilus assembly protein PilO
VAIAGGWFYILKMSDNVNKFNTEIYTIKAQTEKLAELSWRYQRVLPKRGVVMAAIPDSKDESTFMADMEGLAGKNGLAINSSSVGTSQTKASKTGAFSQTLIKDDYYELPLRYEVTGQYGNFIRFVEELSTLRRLNSVNDVSVTADFSDKNVTGRIKATFVITIYAKK